MLNMNSIGEQLQVLRKEAGIRSMEELAKRAGVSRMTIQRIEAGEDVRLQTLQDVLRALGMELMVVPTVLRPALTDFVQAQGKLMGQPSGVAAPLSAIDALRLQRVVRQGRPGGEDEEVEGGGRR